MALATERADNFLFAAIILIEPRRAIVNTVGNGADREFVGAALCQERTGCGKDGLLGALVAPLAWWSQWAGSEPLIQTCLPPRST